MINSELSDRAPSKEYTGYTGCPVLIGGNKILMAEFKYDKKIDPSFYKDQRKPSRLVYYMKKYLFPFTPHAS